MQERILGAAVDLELIGDDLCAEAQQQMIDR